MPQTQADSSSSNTSASFRSRVSNPSVNQSYTGARSSLPGSAILTIGPAHACPRSRQSRAMLSGAKFPGLSFLLTRDRGPGEDEASVELAKLERR